MARRNVAEVATGAVVLVVAFGFLGYAVAHSGRGPASGYTLFARFDHIDGLSIGSDVRMAGVKIGTVTGAQVDPKTYLADVALTVRDDIQLPKDSSAEITSDGLLGGKYLSLSPGGDSQMLVPGSTITITQSSVSLEQLLGKFIFSVTDMTSAIQKQNQGQGQGQRPGQSGGQPGGAGGKPGSPLQ